jgi:hypothetical protein
MTTKTIAPKQTLLRNILTDAVESGIFYWVNEPGEDGTLQLHHVERALKDEDEFRSVTGLVFDVKAVEDVSGAKVLPTLVRATREGRDLVFIDAFNIMQAARAIVEDRVTFGGKALGPNSQLRALASKVLHATNRNADDVDYDAGDADNLVQAALFGDIVYG